jgi:heme oxygenase
MPETAQRATLRQFLFDATREKHQQVDRLYGSLDLRQKTDFKVFLTAQYFALRILENCLQRVDQVTLERGDQIALLKSDLDILGNSDLPALPLLPQRHTICPLGCLYVVTGASIGKRLLRQQWLGSSDATALRAHHFMMDETMQRGWPQLVKFLDQQEQYNTGHSWAHTAKGAAMAFDVFITAYHLATNAVLSGVNRVAS